MAMPAEESSNYEPPPSPFARDGPRAFSLRRFLFRATVLLVAAIVVGALLLRVEAPDRHGAKAMEENQFLLGAWLGDWPGGDNDLLRDFEEATGARLHLVDIFIDWYTPAKNVTYTIEYLHQHGAIPILTWEPHGYTTAQIVQGTGTIPLRDHRRVPIDQYIDEFAAAVCEKTSDQPVLMRPIHEMNGAWYTWGIAYQGSNGGRPNSPETYKEAWIKLHTAFESRCPDGVKWIWAVNHYSTGGTNFLQTYPGPDYVDYVGLDGYNWGDRADWGWQSFETLFKPGYCAVTTATPHPVIIAELGSTESGGSKAQWIRDAFGAIQDGRYGRIQGVVWFNDPKFEVEIHGEMDWPLDSSASSRQAFAESVQALQAQSARVAGQAGPNDVCR